MPRKKKTNEEFIKEVQDLVQDEYTFLEPYQTAHTKIKVKHNVCDTIYEIRPIHFLNGQRCPNCDINKRTKTDKEFKKEVYNLVGNEYTFLEEYKNNKTKIKVKHNVCNNVYETSPHNFLNGKRCKVCFYKRLGQVEAKTTQQFKEDVYDLVKDEYNVLGQYVNAKTKIKIKHNVCNNAYEVTPTNFLTGYRCPICNQSKGEDKIKEYLDNHSIKYIQHKRFDWLNFQGQQHLDFYLEEYNLAIEYDGIQHYELVNWTGNLSLEEQQANLKHNQELDFNKNKLLKEHNIKLIRIPYTKFNGIDKILNKALTN